MITGSLPGAQVTTNIFLGIMFVAVVALFADGLVVVDQVIKKKTSTTASIGESITVSTEQLQLPDR